MRPEHIIRVAYLISRQLTDCLTDAEQTELETWLSEFSENRNSMKEFTRKEFVSEKEVEIRLYDRLKAFEVFRKRTSRYIFWKRLLPVYGSVAAIAVLLIGFSIFYFRPLTEVRPVQMAEISAGKSRAVLVMAGGEKVQLTAGMSDTIVYTAGMKISATGYFLEYDSGSPGQMEKIAYNTLEVPRHGEFRLTLSDDTKVWINSESRIKYPINFQGSERRVYLEGEAYFEVAKNENMPFVVDLGKAAVRVLGTSFNARAYHDEINIYATLTEGRVQLISGKQDLVLYPEEQGCVDLKSGELTKKKVDTSLYTGWKDGRFIFLDQTLEDIMNTLVRWYDIEVFFENQTVRDVVFSGNLKRYDSFGKVIELLEMTGMVHFKVRGNTIFITE